MLTVGGSRSRCTVGLTERDLPVPFGVGERLLLEPAAVGVVALLLED